MVEKSNLKEIIKELENKPEIQQLPEPIRKLIKNSLESMNVIPFPIITFKENDWILATTPVIDISAQGKTEEEAVKNLEYMIEDYMTDKDTPKPEFNHIINMQISMKNVPMKLPLDELQRADSNSRQNT